MQTHLVIWFDCNFGKFQNIKKNKKELFLLIKKVIFMQKRMKEV